MFGQSYHTLNLAIESMVVVHVCFYLLHKIYIYHKLLVGIPETIGLQDVNLVANSVIWIEVDPTFITKIWIN